MPDWFEPSSHLWCSSSGAHGVPVFLKATDAEARLAELEDGSLCTPQSAASPPPHAIVRVRRVTPGVGHSVQAVWGGVHRCTLGFGPRDHQRTISRGCRSTYEKLVVQF